MLTGGKGRVRSPSYLKIDTNMHFLKIIRKKKEERRKKKGERRKTKGERRLHFETQNLALIFIF